MSKEISSLIMQLESLQKQIKEKELELSFVLKENRAEI